MKLLDMGVKAWIYVWGEKDAPGIAIIFTVLMGLVTFGTVCRTYGLLGF